MKEITQWRLALSSSMLAVGYSGSKLLFHQGGMSNQETFVWSAVLLGAIMSAIFCDFKQVRLWRAETWPIHEAKAKRIVAMASNLASQELSQQPTQPDPSLPNYHPSVPDPTQDKVRGPDY